jgi:GH24 family phage-related lysozyme (muramidase)
MINSKKNYLSFDWTPVINFESGGEYFYNKKLSSPTWPGAASGVTIGIGADLGYMTKLEYNKYFSRYFTEEENRQLISVIGKKGLNAKSALRQISPSIKLKWEDAIEIFKNWTLPKFWSLANSVWPGLDNLCESAQVALVSIVFNRGTSLSGASRLEMRKIKVLVPQKNYALIAKEIRSMKRLWANKKLNGLLRRRDKEALMVESCL